MHFWQNDQGLLCATVVTRGWNGHRTSQHTKLTLEKKSLRPPLPGFKLATFRSQVWQSYQQAVWLPSNNSSFVFYSRSCYQCLSLQYCPCVVQVLHGVLPVASYPVCGNNSSSYNSSFVFYSRSCYQCLSLQYCSCVVQVLHGVLSVASYPAVLSAFVVTTVVFVMFCTMPCYQCLL